MGVCRRVRKDESAMFVRTRRVPQGIREFSLPFLSPLPIPSSLLTPILLTGPIYPLTRLLVLTLMFVAVATEYVPAP